MPSLPHYLQKEDALLTPSGQTGHDQLIFSTDATSAVAAVVKASGASTASAASAVSVEDLENELGSQQLLAPLNP